MMHGLIADPTICPDCATMTSPRRQIANMTTYNVCPNCGCNFYQNFAAKYGEILNYINKKLFNRLLVYPANYHIASSNIASSNKEPDVITSSGDEPIQIYDL